MCLPAKKRAAETTGGAEAEDDPKTYEDLQTTLTLLEVMICLNIRRYLTQPGPGAAEPDFSEDSWTRNGGMALLASCSEFQVPYFSPEDGADDD